MKKVKVSVERIRASIKENSYNEEANTIEVVFATETPVKRYDWSHDRYYNEVLDISEESIDFSRLNNGAPVLDAHSMYSLESVIGVVESAWISGKEVRALLRLSKVERDSHLVSKIKDGIIRNVSVGYRVSEYTINEELEIPEYRATKWEPSEISFVPIPADYNSGVRNEKEESYNLVNIKNYKNRIMPKENQPENPTTPEVNPQEVEQNVEEIRTQAVQEERRRVADITTACQDAGLDADFARTLIDSENTIDQARAAIIKEISKRSNPAPSNQGIKVTGVEEKEQIRTSIIEGLSERVLPGSVADFSKKERAQKYRNYRLLDLAKERLANSGKGTEFMSDQEIVKRAITTTDFPDLLKGTFDRFLHRIYGGITQEWKELARRTNISDLNPKTGVMVDGRVTFEEMPESSEYKEARFLKNDKASIQLKKFGRKFSISDIAIINDDLDIFSEMPRLMAFGAAEFQSDMVWNLIKNNKSTPDGHPLFDANNHNNTIAVGSDISEASLNAARVAIRKQKSPSGNILGLRPTYLVVPPELQMQAEKMMTAITASDTDKVNTFSGSMSIIVSDKLTNPKEWYVVADPNASIVDGIVYGYLNGQENLRTESSINFNTDSLEIKGSLFFAATLWGYQGWFKNPGQ